MPMATLDLTRKDDSIRVTCLIRRKKVVLTPEEWVRQHILNYLIFHADYPKGMIAVEHPLTYNGGVKRCDVLILNELGKALMIIECKAPDVNVDGDTFYQAAKYDKTLNATCLLVTNGLNHFSFVKSRKDQTLSKYEGILTWTQVKEL